MHNRFGCHSHFFGWDFALVCYITRDGSGHAGQDRKSAGDVMGHKRAGLFDIVYWCVLCPCAQMQHTTEISTHIMRAHNMPCHHHQDTHQQETTHTPPKVPFKCHRNTRKILANCVANIVKHSIKNISNTAKTCCFSLLCLLYFSHTPCMDPKLNDTETR